MCISQTIASHAQVFEAHLDGQQELPVRQTPATGRAVLRYVAAKDSLLYEVAVKNICNVIFVHIHLGQRGKEGDPIPVRTLYHAQPAGGPFSGVIASGSLCSADLKGPLEGKTVGDLVELMRAHKVYIDVHTSNGTQPVDNEPGNYPLGEIRGQVVSGPALALVSLVADLVCRVCSTGSVCA